MPAGRPLLNAGSFYQEQGAGQAVDGTCTEVTLVARQTGVALTLISSDTVVDGSNFLWEAIRLPIGRKVYLEVIASGTNAGAAVGVTVSLYTTAGVQVANSIITITSLTAQRVRLPTAMTLADNTEYVVKYKTSGLLGTAYLYFARFVIR